MEQTSFSVSRRAIFLAGGLAAVAAQALDALPAAADTSTLEKANTQLVKDFCAAWGDDPPDAEKIVSQFMTDDCLVRFGDAVAPVNGQAATIALFQTFLSNGERYELKILQTFAHGPVVVNARTDSTITGDRRVNPTSVVGVFVIKDGRIREWSDYV